MSLNKTPLGQNFTPSSPSPSLSDLLITDVDFDSDGPDFATSSSSSRDSDFVSCDSFEFSFYEPSYEPSEELCIADDVFHLGRLLPRNICKSQNRLQPPVKKTEPITAPKVRSRWYMFACGSMRAPSSEEIEMRDIKKHANRLSLWRRNKFEKKETRRSSAIGWGLIRSLSCRAVESVDVAGTTPFIRII